MVQVFDAVNLEGMAAAAAGLSAAVTAGVCLALYGPIGAGKTTLTAMLAEALAAHGQASSPTFALMHIYQGRLPIYHIDCYRLPDADAVADADLDAYFDADGLCLVEWAQIAAPLLPEDTWHLTIDFREKGRRLTLTGCPVLLDGWSCCDESMRLIELNETFL